MTGLIIGNGLALRTGIGGAVAGLAAGPGLQVSSGTSGAPYTMAGGTGSFNLSGQDAGLLAARPMPAANGSFALSGQAATLTYTSLALDGSESDGTQIISNSSIAQVNMKTSGYWAPVNGSYGSNVNSPAGTTTASPMIENSSTAAHFAVQSNFGFNVTVTGGTYVTLSIYAQMTGRRYLALRMTNGADSNGFVAVFDLQTASYAGVSGNIGNGSFDSASVATGANGFTKCMARGIISSADVTGGTVWFGMNTTATTNLGANYAGDGTSGIILWRPKIVQS